ncbi:PD-(D/E)XK nuclease family protein [Candidatus Woesearchaeota archaeon]|nr:PD-(D/E)XK nuclease family protein [Candidatus Woesearchaeota archaeon]
MILNKVLNHPGGFYEYKLHDFKSNEFCTSKFSSLKDYLHFVLKNCPDSYFRSGPRSSALKFQLPQITPVNIKNHDVSILAKYGLEINKERYSANHPKVQNFMLENDKNTIAIEVPIWLKENELSLYDEIFNSKEPLTGHIDLLRIEGDKIWIWDYKPNALKERYASTQVYFYALMMSKRTNINLENFRCGYFDDKDSFVFSPENIQLTKTTQDLVQFIRN